MSEEPSDLLDLLKPIVLNWDMPKLTAVVNDYALRRDINAWIWSQNGHIFINHDKGVIGSLVSFNGRYLDSGEIQLIPQINYEALKTAVIELKLWRYALGAASGDGPKLPAREGDTAKWRALWRLIQEWADKGENAKEIQTRIERMDTVGTDFENLPVREHTIRRVIEAGRAGLLDNLH